MLVVLAIAALAILACVVVVSLGRGGELTEFPPDVPPLGLPQAGQLTAVDFMALQLPVNLVGYHTQSVDETLRRAANAISARDTRIAVLEQRVAELLASRLHARQEAYAGPGTAPRTEHRPDAPSVALPEDEGAASSAAHAEGALIARFGDHGEVVNASPLDERENSAPAVPDDEFVLDHPHGESSADPDARAFDSHAAAAEPHVAASDPHAAMASDPHAAMASDPHAATASDPHVATASDPDGPAPHPHVAVPAPAAKASDPRVTASGADSASDSRVTASDPNGATADPNGAAPGAARVGHHPVGDTADAERLQAEKTTPREVDEHQDGSAGPELIDQSPNGAAAPDGTGPTGRETAALAESEIGHGDAAPEEADQEQGGSAEPEKVGRSWGDIGSPSDFGRHSGETGDSRRDRAPGGRNGASGLPASIGQDRERRS
ncbi:hypothetical protein [Nonomuraea sp. bgisy101]|uniref:hypothetical protein n=1 Tax=Nonomuraea sp. bgisy101 TaxID=3413784 RepID=UPI003D72ED20